MTRRTLEKERPLSVVSLPEILEARERRAAERQRFQTEFSGTCLSLSLNIPGAEKDSPRIRALFRYALRRIQEAMSVSAFRVLQPATGPQAVFAVAEPPETAKEAACRLEQEKEYCRLLDVDVYTPSGEAVSSPSRAAKRPCFLCERQAAACMREKRHSPAEIALFTDKLFISFQADMSRDISEPAAYYASLGLEAMLHEVAASPSPGLVDPVHNGSHQDTDFFTFQRSSAALAFSLARCAEAGLRHEGAPGDLLPVLRVIGREAEKKMFRATNGVNTQKGLLFSLGLALGAVGLLVRGGALVCAESLGRMLREMTAGIAARELGGSLPRTAGERMYLDFGITGIRGEVQAGLPSVLRAGLPALEKALAGGEDCNRALLRTLIALMAEVDDTVILARSSSLETLRAVQARARDLQRSGLLDRENWREAVWELDRELVLQNLSPGGSADLLALTWFLHRAGAQGPQSG